MSSPFNLWQCFLWTNQWSFWHSCEQYWTHLQLEHFFGALSSQHASQLPSLKPFCPLNALNRYQTISILFMVSCTQTYFILSPIKNLEILTYLVNILSRCNALPVVLAMAEVGHQHLQQLWLLVWKFFYALQIVMIKLDFSFLHIFLESLKLKILLLPTS